MEMPDKNISIKKAVLEDASKIAAIHKNCVLKTNARFYPNDVIKEWIKPITAKNIKYQFKNSQWFVIKIKNKIVGFCQICLKEKSLDQINISPKYQNKKYGKLVYDFVERQFLKNNINEIYLNSTLNAVDFYKRLGFRKLRRIRFKLGRIFVEMIKMKKNLIQTKR